MCNVIPIFDESCRRKYNFINDCLVNFVSSIAVHRVYFGRTPSPVGCNAPLCCLCYLFLELSSTFTKSKVAASLKIIEPQLGSCVICFRLSVARQRMPDGGQLYATVRWSVIRHHTVVSYTPPYGGQLYATRRWSVIRHVEQARHKWTPETTMDEANCLISSIM